VSDGLVQTLECKGCGEAYDPSSGIHLCYGMHPKHPLEVCAPTLARFMESDAFARFIVGPVGSGKSSVDINEIIRRGMETPPCRDGVRRSRFVIVRNTYGELADTTKKTFDQWVPNPSAICEFNKNEFTATIKIHGEDGKVHIEVLFRALDRPDHVKKLLSMELTGAYINEAKEVPKAVFDMLCNRVGRFPSRADVTTKENPDGAYWFGVWLDTNPCDTDHWIYKLFERSHVLEQELDLPAEDGKAGSKIVVRFELFKQPSGLSKEAENLPFLPIGYYQRQVVGKDEDWINVYVRSNWGFVREGKPVFAGYNDAFHCKPVTPNPALPILLGMDFGLTPAAVLGQRAAGGSYQIFDELVSEDMGAVNFAQELRRKISAEYPNRPLRGWGDPAGEGRSQVDERTPFAVVQEAGLPVDAAPTNDVRRRLEAVSGLLKRLSMSGDPALVIDPRCKVLRKGFMGGYCRARVKVSGDERFHDEPVKNAFSHVHDALQYLAVGEGEDTRAIQGATQRKVKVRAKVRRAVKGF
jgi:hypothetical protein